jgi:hypothetical protein
MGASGSEPDTDRLGERPDFDDWVGEVMSTLRARRDGNAVAPPRRLARCRALVALAARRLIRGRASTASS